MSKETFTIGITFIIACTIIVCFKSLMKSRRQKRPKKFRFVSPIEAVDYDLGGIIRRVQEQLDKQWKTCAFPTKIYFGSNKEMSSWATPEEAVSVISALLEQKGWIVKKDATCGPNEVIIDLPRKKF